MSLFTDADHVTQSDMAAVDPEIPDIVAAESLTADQVTTILQQSWDDCAGVLAEATRPYYEDFADPVLAFHTGRYAALQLSRIVVTSEYVTRQSPLQRWMLWMAIGAFYRALCNRRISDRYEDKLIRAQAQVKNAWRSVMAVGSPTAMTPLPCPGATHEIGAGTFAAANLSNVAGGTDPAASYEVAISWVNSAVYQSPQIPVNGESGPSASESIAVLLNNRLRVSIAGLNPPGSITIPRPALSQYVGQTATHWNVYVGAVGGVKYLQNASPIAIGTTTYDFSAAPVLSGNRLWSGQVADSIQRLQRIAGRS